MLMKYTIEDIPDILKKTYTRRITCDCYESYFAEIVEFPGCFARGSTPGEAIEVLELIAIDWLKSTIDQNKDIPDPINNICSGRDLSIRITNNLYHKISLAAIRSGLTINQLISSILHVEFINETIESDMDPERMLSDEVC